MTSWLDDLRHGSGRQRFMVRMELFRGSGIGFIDKGPCKVKVAGRAGKARLET
jgi:hypothetical protein